MNRFIVKNSDVYGETNYEKVHGELLVGKDGELIYKYISKMGECEVIYLPNRVIISRKGTTPVLIDVDMEKTTKFLYKTPELEREFQIKGKKIDYNHKTDVLLVKYEIYEMDTLVNKITIGIKKYK